MIGTQQAMKNAEAALGAEKIVSHPAYDRQAHAKALGEIQNAPAANLANLVEKTESLLRGATAALQNLQAGYQVEAESLYLQASLQDDGVSDRIAHYEKAIAELTGMRREIRTAFEAKHIVANEKYLVEITAQQKIVDMLKQSLKVAHK